MIRNNESLPPHTVYGIGEERAKQLHDHGVFTVAELAECDPEDIATILNVGDGTAEDIVIFAKTTVGEFE